MLNSIILASTSKIRAQLLARAGLDFTIVPARVDEASIAETLQAEGAHPRDIADALAEAKARKVSTKHPTALVLGCDQTLALGDRIFAKPQSEAEALEHLRVLRGQTHHLFSALVIYQNGQPLWRHVGHARMTMRDLSDLMLKDYIARNWQEIRHCVGAYQIEAEGVQLFSAIDGDNFTIQGLPLLPLLNYLAIRVVTAS